MITLTPLSASASSSSTSEPICYLLELDDARILLDMGQRDFRSSQQQDSWEYEEKVRELAPTLSLVLLSHSPLNYLSLYPYARAHWGLKCPVYATQPTVEMGRVVCLAESESWLGEHEIETSAQEGEAKQQENGESAEGTMVSVSAKGKQPLRGPFVPTTEEVHEAFDHIKAIRYNQPIHLSEGLSHVLLTPFPSGHTLGGSLFKLRSPTSGTVLYAVGMNHTAERHIDGMVGGAGNIGYDEGVLRPDLLIVEAGRTNTVNPKRRDREAAFLDLISSTLTAHQSVLLPCDPSPRLLELLVLLDQHWSFKSSESNNPRYRNPAGPWVYPLCLVSRTAQDMVSFARSLIEWMGGVVRDAAAGVDEDMTRKRRRTRGGAVGETSYGALDFKHVQFFSTPMELMHAHPLNRPKLVLAIPPSMSHGPSRWLFTAMASTEGNVVLLTSRGEDGTLARKLYDAWQQRQQQNKEWQQDAGKIGSASRVDQQVSLEMNSKVPLVGIELEEHLEAERMAREKAAAQQAALDRSRRMLEADDLDSDSESDDDSIAAAENIITAEAAGGQRGVDGDAGQQHQQMSFDIFVKGQQTRAARQDAAGGGDQAAGAGAGGRRFRMFPFLERRGRKVDEYGETLDIGQWVRKGKEIEEEGETQELRDAKRKQQQEHEKEQAPQEPPSKFVTEQNQVDLRASVFYVDMDGMHDGQAIKTIVTDLQPRQLIMVRSSTNATQALQAFLATSNGIKEVHAPGTGEAVKIGQHVQSFSFALGDSITAGLSAKWSKFEGYEVTMVNGKIAFQMGSTVPTLERPELVLPRKVEEPVEDIKPQPQAERITVLPSEVVEPSSSSQPSIKVEPHDDAEPNPNQTAVTIESLSSDPAPIPEPEPEAEPEPVKPPRSASDRVTRPPLPLPASLFIGDLRLAVLRARLQALTPPLPAEFAGSGILICGPGVLSLANQEDVKAGSIVAVRKGDKGVEIEGSVGSVYDLVRKEVYGSFAQVSAA